MHNEILGFDPYQKEYETFLYELTPERAQYIFNRHNNDNRIFNRSQALKISQSIASDGWLQDGGALTFNVEGNITEFQHRLWAIIQNNITVTVPVVLGVATDCFTKTAAPKPRRPDDEIQRKDPNALSSEITTLRELLKRRRTEQLTMQNAVEKWVEWKDMIRCGHTLIDEFFVNTDKFSAYRRVFSSWATLMAYVGREDVAKNLLTLLENQLLDNDEASSTRLTQDLVDFFMRYSWEMPNAGRTEFMYQLLCVASDRIEKSIDGSVELNVTIDKMHHDNLKKRGFYRKFLENPDNIIMNTLPLNDD